MKEISAISAIKTVSHVFIASIMLSGLSPLLLGQTPATSGTQGTSTRVPVTQVDVSATRTTADETFELNIDERRYTQETFEASTAVGISTGEKLSLQIGVALASKRINVLMRNVQGSVHFRGTLERILDIFNTRHVQPPRTPSAPSPTQSPSPSPD